MSDGTDPLDVIEAAPTAITIAGRVASIRPLKIGQIPAFTRALRPMMGGIAAAVGGDNAITIGTALVDLIADHGEGIIELLAVATQIPAAEIAEADPAELVPVIQAVISVNKDFLLGRLIPALRAAVVR